MSTVSNDEEFRRGIAGLDAAGQRALAARFLQNVLSLAGDERISRVAEIAAQPDASERELKDALHQARTVAVEMHNRCGAECNWRDQAGYFVARAALAAVSPAGQLPGGSAWQTAMSSRMASTCKSIDTAEDTTGQEQHAQYRMLSEFIDS
jgi:hypothetical protein